MQKHFDYCKACRPCSNIHCKSLLCECYNFNYCSTKCANEDAKTIARKISRGQRKSETTGTVFCDRVNSHISRSVAIYLDGYYIYYSSGSIRSPH